MAIYGLRDERLHPFHPRLIQDGLYEEDIAVKILREVVKRLDAPSDL